MPTRTNWDTIMYSFMRLLALISIAVAGNSYLPAEAESVRGAGEASNQKFDAPGLGSKTRVAARKGTRNYRPDGAPPLAPVNTGSQSQDATSNNTQTLEQCMATWDQDTHMTKNAWRETCRRLMKERATKPGT